MLELVDPDSYRLDRSLGTLSLRVKKIIPKLTQV
jgi:hypothetical protein